jgi:hypothetical protein
MSKQKHKKKQQKVSCQLGLALLTGVIQAIPATIVALFIEFLQ